MKIQNEQSFGEFQKEGHFWITLSTGEYYPDVLPLACELYKPVLVTFGHLLDNAHSSTDLFLAITKTTSTMDANTVVSCVPKVRKSRNPR